MASPISLPSVNRNIDVVLSRPLQDPAKASPRGASSLNSSLKFDGLDSRGFKGFARTAQDWRRGRKGTPAVDLKEDRSLPLLAGVSDTAAHQNARLTRSARRLESCNSRALAPRSTAGAWRKIQGVRAMG